MFEETVSALNAALRGVKGLRVDVSGWLGAEPPAATVGPPTVAWETYSETPTDVKFSIMVYVARDERAIGRLLALLPQVVEAVESVENAVVTEAQPEQFLAGATPLPAYRLTVEVT